MIIYVTNIILELGLRKTLYCIAIQGSEESWLGVGVPHFHDMKRIFVCFVLQNCYLTFTAQR